MSENKPKNFLQKYPLVPTIFFVLFAWSLLHLITSFKESKKTNSFPKNTSDSLSKVLSPKPKSKPATLQFLACHGTEPFWSVKISPKEIVFESPNEEKPTKYPYTQPKEASMVSLEYLSIYESKSSDNKSYIKIIVSKRGANCFCTDGMSDATFEYEVIIEKDGVYYRGCCKKQS
jgi:uncharacterized membrane protein